MAFVIMAFVIMALAITAKLNYKQIKYTIVLAIQRRKVPNRKTLARISSYYLAVF
jgi:hypothetical protein